MNRKTFNKMARAAVIGGTAVAGASLAHAGGGFTLPTELTAAVVSVGVVGAGVFAIKVGVKLYKWFQAAL